MAILGALICIIAAGIGALIAWKVSENVRRRRKGERMNDKTKALLAQVADDRFPPSTAISIVAKALLEINEALDDLRDQYDGTLAVAKRAIRKAGRKEKVKK